MASRVASGAVLALVVALGCLGDASVARADDDAQKRARAFFQQGVDATAHAAYAEALAAFEQAYALRPHPATLYNIALSQWALGQPDAALRSLEQALAHAELSQDKRAQVEAQRSEWLGRVGKLRLSIEPEDARVRVGGQSVEGRECLVMAPGWAQVDVERRGQRTSTHRVYVRSGAVLDLSVVLERPAAPSSDMAELEVVSFPYGKVWLNGAFAGDSPLRLKLPAGSYRVGGGREIAEGETTLELAPRESRQVVVHWDRERHRAPNARL